MFTSWACRKCNFQILCTFGLLPPPDISIRAEITDPTEWREIRRAREEVAPHDRGRNQRNATARPPARSTKLKRLFFVSCDINVNSRTRGISADILSQRRVRDTYFDNRRGATLYFISNNQAGGTTLPGIIIAVQNEMQITPPPCPVALVFQCEHTARRYYLKRCNIFNDVRNGFKCARYVAQHRYPLNIHEVEYLRASSLSDRCLPGVCSEREGEREKEERKRKRRLRENERSEATEPR